MKDKGMIEIGGLWEFRGGGGFAGNFGKARIVVLPNKYKKAGDKSPDYRLFFAESEERKSPYAGQGGDVGLTPTVKRQENYGTSFADEDVPF